MAKTGEKGKGPTRPMGAAPQVQWSEVADRKKMTKMLTDMARRMPAEQRAKFLADGRRAIDTRMARAVVQNQFKAMMAELEPVFKRHGVDSFHLIVNLPKTKELVKTGQKGWAIGNKVKGQDSLELSGILAGALQSAVSGGIGRLAI